MVGKTSGSHQMLTREGKRGENGNKIKNKRAKAGARKTPGSPNP